MLFFFFFKQKTAYEMRISDWSSDVCSSDLTAAPAPTPAQPSTEAPAGKMTQEQIAAFNQAVADFTAGQQLQQAANNAGAIAKYEGALPAIRTAVTDRKSVV